MGVAHGRVGVLCNSVNQIEEYITYMIWLLTPKGFKYQQQPTVCSG